MNMQYLIFVIAAPFACAASGRKKPRFKQSLGFDFVFYRLAGELVFHARPVRICTASATGLFILASKDRCAANDTGYFFSARNPIAGHSAKDFSIAVLKYGWPSIHGSVADDAFGIRLSFICFIH